MQNKYLKYLLIIAVVSFIVPQIALAAWWNPFSWHWNIFNWFAVPHVVRPITIKQNNENQTQQSQNNNSDNTIGNDETANWKTYINTEYNFEFRYPKRANAIDTAEFLKKNNLNYNQSCANSPQYLLMSIEDLYFTISIRCESLTREKVNNFVNATSQYKPFDSYKGKYYSSFSVDNLSVNERESYKVQYSTTSDTSGLKLTKVYIALKDNKYILIEYVQSKHSSGRPNIAGRVELTNEEAGKILSSFKFTK